MRNNLKLDASNIGAIVNADDYQSYDLVFENITVVDVIAHELRQANVAIRQGHIAYVGNEACHAKHTIDGTGKFLSPGFMDSHVHVESSMLSLPEFARAVLPHGTTAVFGDPHEIANVLGRRGVELFLQDDPDLPFRYFLQVPSRVPTAKGLEGTGGELTVDDTIALLDHKSTVSLGEIPVSLLMDPSMNVDLFEKIAAAHTRHKLINGHAPAVDQELGAFLASGINDDHTCIDLEDGIEKVRAGIWIMIKESSLDKNLDKLYPLLQRYPHRVNLCCDDVDPVDLAHEGHMDHRLRRAIALGVEPVNAYMAATFTTAQRHHLEEFYGSITPGKVADLVVLSDLEQVAVDQVWIDGELVVDQGDVIKAIQPWQLPEWATHTVNLPPITSETFLTAADEDQVVRVINLIPGAGPRNRGTEEKLAVNDGYLVIHGDINYLTAINRHGKSQHASAFVRGFSIKGGAVASSIAHDHHNLMVVGDNPRSMLIAAKEIEKMQGGLAVVNGIQVAAAMPLTIAGLMSERSLHEVVEDLEACIAAAASLGCELESPFMSLSFVGLPSMPEYGLTDVGLVYVSQNSLVPVVIE
jgi:adenine deaminase